MSHVFVSYVRENAEQVDRLCGELQAAGIDVWLDREDLVPGQRWQDAIRHAIESGTYFLACFSSESLAKERTYMNEELVLAIEELRRRPTDRAWFIPVLLSECSVPSRSIGGGETLRDIHWVDLHRDWDAGVRQIIAATRSAVRSSYRRSPWLGAEFWQDDRKSTLLDAGSNVVRVPLRPQPFEIRIPTAEEQDSVMIAGSYDPGIFEHVAHKMPREHVPYFRSGTGMADSSFGSGQLWIQPEAHMHLDWGRRLGRHPDGGGVVLFNAIHELREKEPRWPVKRDVYVVIHVARKTEPELLNWNFEKFILSF